MCRVVLDGSEPMLTGPTALFEDSGNRVIQLDLSGVDFVCPLDLVALAAWACTIPRKRRGEVLFGTSPVASYLDRMLLLPRLREGGWSVPEVETRPYEDLPETLLEITALSDPHEVEDLADRLPRLWAGRAGDPTKSRALHFAFGELSDNATTHSGESPIFVAAQRYSGRTSPHAARLEMAVADAGIGIPQHLRSNPAYAHLTEDREAIAKALQPGVTGTSDQRGYGFHDVITELGDVGRGELIVTSGRGQVTAPFGDPARRRSSRPLDRYVHGTWVQVRLYE